MQRRIKQLSYRLACWGFCLGLLFSLAKTHEVISAETTSLWDEKTERELARLVENRENPSFENEDYSIQEFGDGAHLLNYTKSCLEFGRQENQAVMQIMATIDKELSIKNASDLKKFKDFNFLIRVRNCLEEASKQFSEHVDKNKEWLCQLRINVSNIHFENSQIKALFLSEIDEAINNKQIKKYALHSKRFIEESLAMINFYISNFDSYRFENDRLIFDNEDGAQVHLIRMQILSGLEKEMIKDKMESEELVNNFIKSLNKQS